MQSKTTRDAKSLPAKLLAESVSSCKTTSQLGSLTGFLSNVLLWHRLTFNSRVCVWSVLERVIWVKARKRKKEVAINGKAILYLYWFVRRFQVYSNLSFNALDMIKVFPSANVHAPGHLKDGAVQGGQPAGQYQTDFAIDL